MKYFVAMLAVLVLWSAVDAGPERIAEAAFPGADSVSLIAQTCLPDGRVEIDVVWTGYNQGPQWVDLSLFDNGFAPNSFIGLQANQNSMIWDGLLPGLTHYLRVNTLTNIGWVPSSTLAFTTRGDCPASGAFPGAAGVALAQQTCNPDGKVGITVSWSPSMQVVQWVDLTLFNNNFATGTFIGAGPLPANQASLTWNGLLPGLVHYLRVNTLTQNGWWPSQTITFATRADCQNQYSTQPVSIPGTASGPNQAILTDVRIGAHPEDGYDRIVFEFSNILPDVQVAYQNAAAGCGSGLPIALPGTAVLGVRLFPAVAHDSNGNLTVPSLDVAGTGASVLEAKGTCDFEAVVGWAAGIASQKGFHVTTLANPPRVVIDVQR